MKEFTESLEVTLKVIEFSLWAGFTAVCVRLLVGIWRRFRREREAAIRRIHKERLETVEQLRAVEAERDRLRKALRNIVDMEEAVFGDDSPVLDEALLALEGEP